MYIIEKPNHRVALLDDVGFTTYTKQNMQGETYTYTMYMPKDVFVANIETLKGKPINFEHEENVAPRGTVIDVVHNLEGIQLPNGDILSSKSEKGEWYAIMEIKEEFLEEAKKIKAISTEYDYIDRVLKKDFNTHPYTRDLIQDGKIDGDVDFDVVAVKVEYTGLALTDNPKRTRTMGKVYNSNNIEEKKLDKTTSHNKLNKFLKSKMENTVPDIKNIVIEALQETLPEMVKNSILSYEAEKEKNAQEEERVKSMEEMKMQNSNLADENAKLKEEIEALKNAKNSANEDKEENSEGEEKKDGEKNSNNAPADISKQAKMKTGEKNSNNENKEIAGLSFFKNLKF